MGSKGCKDTRQERKGCTSQHGIQYSPWFLHTSLGLQPVYKHSCHTAKCT